VDRAVGAFLNKQPVRQENVESRKGRPVSMCGKSLCFNRQEGNRLLRGKKRGDIMVFIKLFSKHTGIFLMIKERTLFMACQGNHSQLHVENV